MKAAGQLRRRLRKGVFLLPSLFTSANLLLGFYAIILGYNDRFSLACLLLFLAAIIDTLDGRIARMTGTESEFGREYDSLADLTTFGTAPALLCYFWGLEHIGRAGWLIPALFVVCAASRLARFNIQTAVLDARYFVGLPAPAAACSVASILFAFPYRSALPDSWRAPLTALVTVSLLLVGMLMVSTFRYVSFKKLDLKRPWSYRIVLPMSAIVLAVALRPEAFFLSIGILYTLSAPLLWLVGRLRSKGAAPNIDEPKPRETP
jgi:CDP-diacylglycerol--serine O-phosphatidyltransferase